MAVLGSPDCTVVAVAIDRHYGDSRSSVKPFNDSKLHKGTRVIAQRAWFATGKKYVDCDLLFMLDRSMLGDDSREGFRKVKFHCYFSCVPRNNLLLLTLFCDTGKIKY